MMFRLLFPLFVSVWLLHKVVSQWCANFALRPNPGDMNEHPRTHSVRSHRTFKTESFGAIFHSVKHYYYTYMKTQRLLFKR